MAINKNKLFKCIRGIGLLFFLTGCPAPRSGKLLDTVEKTFYDENIQPIFNTHCFRGSGCHKTQASSEVGLELSSFIKLMEGATKGSGSVVIPGDSKNSLIIKRLRNIEVPAQMPKGLPPLDETLIQLIEAWIDSGATNE